jgi:hypothetical protein
MRMVNTYFRSERRRRAQRREPAGRQSDHDDDHSLSRHQRHDGGHEGTMYTKEPTVAFIVRLE